MRGRGFWIVSLIVACVVLAGCGSGGGDTTSGGNGGSTSTGGSESSGKSESGNENGGASGGEAGNENGGASDGESGGGEANGSPSFESPAASKAEFIKRGDLICEEVPQEYSKKLEALEKELEKKSGKKLLQKAKVQPEEATLKAGVPPLRTAVKKFEALGPPQGEEAQAIEIIEALEAAADELEQDPSLPLIGAKSPFGEFIKLTKQFGFKFCPQL